MANDPSSEPAPDIASLSFAQAFQRLVELADSLDAGGLTLAEAAGRYEQGMVLVRRCNQLLDTTELKITNLKDAYAQGFDSPAGQDLDENDPPPDDLPF